ncbi:MAG: hypothetical protein JWO36_7420 [Myxococcales bacterium]|nr:hypothetical protein [Myxococcales bacterium]
MTLYPYFVDPLRLRAVYGGKDVELGAKIRAGLTWPPTVGEAVSADEALDQILRGAILDSSVREVYTSVLESICGTIGIDATEHLDEDDHLTLEGELIEIANQALRRIGVAELAANATTDHPFLPGIGRPQDIPMIEVYEAADCARTAAVIDARWSDFTADEVLGVGPVLRLLEHRRYHDVLIVFSY